MALLGWRLPLFLSPVPPPPLSGASGLPSEAAAAAAAAAAARKNDNPASSSSFLAARWVRSVSFFFDWDRGGQGKWDGMMALDLGARAGRLMCCHIEWAQSWGIAKCKVSSALIRSWALT